MRQSNLLLCLWHTLLLLALSCYSLRIAAQNKPVEVHGSVTFTNNGIDPVPAFALGKPALMSSLFITKGNFIYNAQINYSVTDFKPWSESNWLLYKIPVSSKGYIRTGFSLAFFHKREVLGLPANPTATTQILNQYVVFETSYIHKFSTRFSFTFTNWAEKGVEWDAVPSSNFTSIAASLTGLRLRKNFFWNFFPSAFYATNRSPFDGFFVSETTTLFYKKFKIGLSNQIAVPIYSKPTAELVWNIGLIYKY